LRKAEQAHPGSSKQFTAFLQALMKAAESSPQATLVFALAVGKHLEAKDAFKEEHERAMDSLAYNLGNFLRRLALPKPVRHWSLTTSRDKLIKIGGKLMRHSKYATFQLAEVALTRNLFAAILDRTGRGRFRRRFWHGE
jgi:ABC-type sulfate transport system substrate-binding protein